MSKRLMDRIIVIAVILIAAAMLIGTKNIPIVNGAKKDIGSAVFPQILSGLLIILSLLKLIVSFTNHDEDYIRKAEAKEKSDYVRGIGSIVLLSVYFMAMKTLGFFPSSFLYLFIQMLIFVDDGKKNYVKYGIIAFVTSAVVYVSFVYGLNLMLPAGILTAFL